MQFSELHRRRDLDLDLESGHTAYRHASLIDLHIHTKFHWNWTNFLWTEVQTDIPTTDRRRFPSLMLLGWLKGVDLNMATNNWFTFHLSYSFTSHLTRNRSFWRCSSQPISWLLLRNKNQQELSNNWDGRLFGHNRHGLKSRGLLCPFLGDRRSEAEATAGHKHWRGMARHSLPYLRG